MMLLSLVANTDFWLTKEQSIMPQFTITNLSLSLSRLQYKLLTYKEKSIMAWFTKPSFSLPLSLLYSTGSFTEEHSITAQLHYRIITSANFDITTLTLPPLNSASLDEAALSYVVYSFFNLCFPNHWLWTSHSKVDRNSLISANKPSMHARAHGETHAHRQF